MTVSVPHDVQPSILHQPFWIITLHPLGQAIQIRRMPLVEFQQRLMILLSQSTQQGGV